MLDGNWKEFRLMHSNDRTHTAQSTFCISWESCQPWVPYAVCAGPMLSLPHKYSVRPAQTAWYPWLGILSAMTLYGITTWTKFCTNWKICIWVARGNYVAVLISYYFCTKVGMDKHWYHSVVRAEVCGCGWLADYCMNSVRYSSLHVNV